MVIKEWLVSILLQTLKSYRSTQNKVPKRIIVCTHAKFSAVELCSALISLGSEVVFYPVGYSRNKQSIDSLIALGVQVVDQTYKLIPLLKQADCAIEDGARISKIIQEEALSMKKAFFSVEQTSGGIRFFIESPPAYPVVNVAMSPVKLGVENKHATPEGVLRYYSEATGKLLQGKNVFVIGYGNIGEGVARLARTFGAHVTVYDTFATKRMFAKHQGYSIIEKVRLDHILPAQDVIFMATNTYQGSLLGYEQLLLMRDGAIICNAGSGRGELALELQSPGTYKIHDSEVIIRDENDHLIFILQKYDLQKTITVLAKAFPINLHIGVGTSHDAIEIVMALLLLAALEGPSSRTKGLQPLSFDLQELVAEAVLQSDIHPKTFSPIHIKTKSLPGSEKPYGSIFPFHNELSEMANLSVARVQFRTKTKTRGHYHRRTQESYYVEKGTANLVLWPNGFPDEITTYSLQSGDYLLVPENYFHDVRVTSSTDFECLVIATPPFLAWDQFFKESDHRETV